jgi:hypothetical protein
MLPRYQRGPAGPRSMDRREEGDREWGEWNGEDVPPKKVRVEQKSD